MTALSNFAENELLDHLLGVGSWTKPTNTYLQLHTGSPGEDCTANVAATNTRLVTAWAAAASRAIATNAALDYTAAASETISHVSLWDASTSGNPICYGALGSSVATGGTGNTFTIASGNVAANWTAITSAISTYAGNALLDHLTGRASFTMPSGIYVQLHTGAPGLAGTSNVATTNTRVAATFGAASGGASSNTGAVSFTAAGNETITHFSLWDASTSGNCLWVDAVTTSRAITTGQTVRFAVGALVPSLA